MIHSKNMLETVVGAIVLILCVLFVFIVYRNGSLDSYNNDNNYVLNASFERIDGISVGSSVMISGINVGKVVEQYLDSSTYNAVLKISIHSNIKLPLDTSAEIVSSSLLGDKYIALVPGADTEYLKGDDHIEFTQSSISIESLISKMVFGLEMQSKKSDDTNGEEENCDEQHVVSEGVINNTNANCNTVQILPDNKNNIKTKHVLSNNQEITQNDSDQKVLIANDNKNEEKHDKILSKPQEKIQSQEKSSSHMSPPANYNTNNSVG